MANENRRAFFKVVGAAVAAGIVGVAGGYFAGLNSARSELEKLTKQQQEEAKKLAEETISKLEAEIQELKEKLSQYEIADKELKIYNWSEYIPEHLLTLFEEKTGVKIIYDTFETSDEVLAKLLTGNMPYDVTVITGGTITLDDYEKYVTKLDYSKIPNYEAYVFDELKNPAYDPGRTFTVPYQSGTSGISFRTDKIAEEDWPTGWHDSLFDFDYFLPKYSPKDGVKTATMIPGGVETIPNVIKGVLGKSINDLSPENIEAAKEVMIQQKPFLAAYAGASEYQPGLDEGRFWISETWVYQSSENNVEYIVPKEGCEIWTDCMIIPKSAKNVEAAYAWINYMFEPTSQLALTIYNGLMTPNKITFDLLPEEMQNDESIYPPPEIMAKLEAWRGRTPEEREILTRAWQEILAA